MRLLDRYLLLEWLKALGLALAATLGLLLFMDMYSNLGDLVSDKAKLRDIFFYYGLLLPSFLPAVLPMSQLVSLLFIVGNLHRNLEITAMRAAGVSLWRIARPWWIGGAVLAVVLGWFDAVVVPSAVTSARAFRDNLHHRAMLKSHPSGEAGLVPDLTYDNGPARRRWFIDSFNTDTRVAHGIHVYEFTPDGRDTRTVLAYEGHFDTATGDWVLSQGREMKFDTTGSPMELIPFTGDRAFAELADDPARMLTLRQNAGNLSLDELRNALTQAPAGGNPALDAYAVEYYSILTKPLICLLIVGLAVPFAVAGIRTGPAVGASKAIGLFFAYYLVSGISTHLGYQHFLPSYRAAGVPIIVMLGLSLWLFRRAA